MSCLEGNQNLNLNFRICLTEKVTRPLWAKLFPFHKSEITMDIYSKGMGLLISRRYPCQF